MSNYIHHTANGRNFIIVEVPKTSMWHEIEGNVLSFDDLAIDSENPLVEQHLPEGNYRILFIAEEATGEQAMGVVESDISLPYLSKNYNPKGKVPKWCAFPRQSLNSLLSFHFNDFVNHKHLILEQI